MKWQQSTTCISSSISGTLAQEDAEGGTRGCSRNLSVLLPWKGTYDMFQRHWTCSQCLFSLSTCRNILQQSQEAKKNPCAHGLRRRWSDIPVMRMEKPKQNHRPWSTRAIGMITARVSHQIAHTRKTRVMKKRRTKGERDGERRGRWRERARARVCAFTSVDQSKCTVC